MRIGIPISGVADSRIAIPLLKPFSDPLFKREMRIGIRIT